MLVVSSRKKILKYKVVKLLSCNFSSSESNPYLNHFNFEIILVYVEFYIFFKFLV